MLAVSGMLQVPEQRLYQPLLSILDNPEHFSDW